MTQGTRDQIQSKIEIETIAEETHHGWRDLDGFVGPFRPGNGPRTDPRGEFPTGPAVGSKLPDILTTNSDNTPFDLHAERNGRPAVVVFYRSAVW